MWGVGIKIDPYLGSFPNSEDLKILKGLSYPIKEKKSAQLKLDRMESKGLLFF